MQLGHAIAGRGRCLIILDNFEQIVEYASATLGRWLDRAPTAAFVVTSRERLHLPGEEIFPIEPLPLEQDAIELFATRARAQKPDFVLGDAIARQSPRSCGCSTVCRSRSSWRPRACACFRRRNSSSGCAIGSVSLPAPAARPRARPRSGPRSTGRGTCSRPGSRPRSRSARCSTEDSRSRPPRRCSTFRLGRRRRRRWT